MFGLQRPGRVPDQDPPSAGEIRPPQHKRHHAVSLRLYQPVWQKRGQSPPTRHFFDPAGPTSAAAQVGQRLPYVRLRLCGAPGHHPTLLFAHLLSLVWALFFFFFFFVTHVFVCRARLFQMWANQTQVAEVHAALLGRVSLSCFLWQNCTAGKM